VKLGEAQKLAMVGATILREDSFFTSAYILKIEILMSRDIIRNKIDFLNIFYDSLLPTIMLGNNYSSQK
jgi:hypothetical protein